MISDYDIVGTKFLGVFPLNLYRLDHGIGPCNVSIMSIRRLHQSDGLGEQNGSQVGAWTANANIGIIADILYMEMKQETDSKKKMWSASSKQMLGDLPPVLCSLLIHSMTLR